MMEKFPDELKDCVKSERFEKFVSKFSLLTKNFSENSVNKLINYV